MNNLVDELVSALKRAETAHGRVWAATAEMETADAAVKDIQHRIIAIDPQFDFTGLLPNYIA